MDLDYETIGNKIKKIRLSKNISQLQLASKLGVSGTYISRIERGAVKINLRRLSQIAKILDVSVNNLMDGRYIDEGEYIKEDLLELFEKCEVFQKKMIFQIAEVIFENTIDLEKKKDEEEK